jgi:signal transduction histidine kinase
MSSDPSSLARVQDIEARLRSEERKLRLVREIGQALAHVMDLDRLLSLIMDKITELMTADRSTLFVLSDDGKELWSRVIQGGSVLNIRLAVGEGIAGWVASSGETVNIPDAYSDTRFQPAVDLRSGYRTRSILCMPMLTGQGQLVGVIQVLNKEGGPFTGEDEQLLEALAAQCAISIANTRLYQSVVQKNVELSTAKARLEQHAADLNVLYEIETDVTAASNLDELLDRMLGRAMQRVGAAAGSILLRERGATELYFRSAFGSQGDTVKRMRVPLGTGVVGWVAAQRQPLIVNDPKNDSRFAAELAARIGHCPRNLCAVPLVDGEGEILGALELLDKRGEGGFDDGDLKLLSLIAGQASRAILLQRAKEERLKESRLASIGQIVSGVLHDLKTPMTIVSGYAQLMAACDDGGERGQYVEHILKQFEQMAAMTREVLAFARGESNVLIRKVFLHRFLEEIAQHMKYEFAGKSVTFSLTADYRGVAYFDEQKMLRVVHNLARNAAQAMQPQGGGIFKVTSTVEGQDLVLEFADTGPGIPAEMEGRLFELFASSGKKDGTGLGLAIVKKIVDEHRGQIVCRSAPGAGTTFRVVLPQAAAVSESPATGSLPRMVG